MSQNIKIIFLAASIGLLIQGFGQGCASPKEFSSLNPSSVLVAGGNDGKKDITNPNQPPQTPPSPHSPPQPPSSDDLVPPPPGDKYSGGGEDPIQDPSQDSSQKFVCYLTQGNGKSDRIGQSCDKIQLGINHGLPSDLCMSANACLKLINNYLNLTNGNLEGVPQSLPPSANDQYTAIGWASPCEHNKNLQQVTDQQVKDLIEKTRIANSVK